jgi:hypothetical protein
MNLKSLFAISITSLTLSTLSLASAFVPAQANTSVQNRTHCVWRKGAFGMQYKSCSAQIRTCKYLSTVGGGGRTECTAWRNRF